MTLENLLRIGQLREHLVESNEIQRLLNAAERNLKDSGYTEISSETRFDAAYKAIIQTATGTKMVALKSEGATLEATLNSPLVKGDKLVVTGKDSHGDTIQARFVKD